MKLLHTSVLLLAATALAACSSTRYCTRAQAYDNAPSIPAIVAPEGLKIPTPSTALRVPEPKGDTLTFAYLAPDPAHPGKNKVQCLDLPPPIPPVVEAPK